jgi:hypothetical protein
MSFDNVWNSIRHWRHYYAENNWSEENLEFLDKALGHADSIRLICLTKEEGWEINPVPADFDEAYDEHDDEVEGDDEADDNANKANDSQLKDVLKKAVTITDVGGSLTNLKAEMDAGVHYLNHHIEFQGPHDLKTDIGHRVKIRLCNSIFATEVASPGKQ